MPCSHNADCTIALLKQFERNHLFKEIKALLATKPFETNEELMSGINFWLSSRDIKFFDKRVEKLVLWYKCLDVEG